MIIRNQVNKSFFDDLLLFEMIIPTNMLRLKPKIPNVKNQLH